MKKRLVITLLLILTIITAIEGKKISRGRSSSGRGTSRKTGYNPQPTSLSYAKPQPSAPKPSLFGWQEKPAQRTQTSNRQSKPTNTKPQTHSYPSSQTGMSGNSPAKQPTHQENIQRSNTAGSNTPVRTAAQPQPNNQAGHSYPASGGLSGNAGSQGAGYPQGSGLSGSGVAGPPPHSSGNNYNTHGQPPAYPGGSGVGYPKQQGTGLSGSGAAPPPYSSGGGYPSNNYGNNYHHPQGPPPPYSNNYGGYGGYHGSYNPAQTPQMPGYFGGYGNNRGFGGMSRSSNVLTGVGIAGAGVGTILTGLALWNLARSTGRHHHTVIYDNRGQPVAVAPANSTEPVVDPILGDLVNCTLTISSDNATEVLAIPCAIATSFTPEADVKDPGSNVNVTDNTKCTVTVVTKTGKEFMTTIPCSILLNTAAENNVTEPPPLPVNATEIVNGTLDSAGGMNAPIQPTALPLSNEANSTEVQPTTLPSCTPEPGDTRDPINPCFTVTQNLTVIPLHVNDNGSYTTPSSA